MLSRFHTIPACHGQTDILKDRQTDRIAISISRVSKITEKLWILRHFKVGGLSPHPFLPPSFLPFPVLLPQCVQHTIISEKRGLKSRRALRYWKVPEPWSLMEFTPIFIPIITFSSTVFKLPRDYIYWGLKIIIPVTIYVNTKSQILSSNFVIKFWLKFSYQVQYQSPTCE